MKKFLVLLPLLLCAVGANAHAYVFVDVYHDAYMDDFTRSQSVAPDGIPDGIFDTNALLAGRGEFFDQFNNYNVNSKAIMTFDVAPYAGQNLVSAKLLGSGTRVDNKGSLDPINGNFFIYSGDGLVGFNDFTAPANGVGAVPFAANPNQFGLNDFELDVKSGLQPYLNGGSQYVEFRVESPSSTVFINAGEVDPASGHTLDTRWPGPRLQLELGVPTAAVPEPMSLALLGGGLVGAFFVRRRKNS